MMFLELPAILAWLVYYELLRWNDKLDLDFYNESIQIHVINVSLNVSLNDDHQMLKYLSFNPFMSWY